MNGEDELSTELKDFIDQLIVSLLVDTLLTQQGHLYSAAPSYYDDERPLAEAAEEAA